MMVVGRKSELKVYGQRRERSEKPKRGRASRLRGTAAAASKTC